MKGKLLRCAAILVVAGWSQLSSGAVIYDYVGNDFTEFPTEGSLAAPENYQPGDKVIAWFEFEDLLASSLADAVVEATAFSFTDGVQSIDSTNATGSSFLISTDADGLPLFWVIGAQIWEPTAGNGEYHSISSLNYPDHPAGAPPSDSGGTLKCGPDPEPMQSGCSLSEPYYSSAGISRIPGVWSLRPPSEVPVPAAAWLFGSALLGLSAIKRKKASSIAASC